MYQLKAIQFAAPRSVFSSVRQSVNCSQLIAIILTKGFDFVKPWRLNEGEVRGKGIIRALARWLAHG
jgi:hypothetical protein